MELQLERLDFEQTNKLLVDLFQNKKDIYYEIHKDILSIRNLNGMINLTTDKQLEEALLRRRKELIENVLRTTK